jgi:hypothetical protein
LPQFLQHWLRNISAALVLGLGVAAVALVIPLQWLLITILFMAAVVGGGAEYFLNIGQANWLPFILATLVGLRAALFESFKFGSRVQEKQFKRSVAWFWIPVFVYIFTLFAAAVVNFVPLAQLLASVKNYLLMWGVLIAFLHLNDVERTSVLLWRWVLVIAALQLPVVLIQRFFIASKLTNSSSSLSFDAINGTFGGGLLGGRSGALTMFLCIAIAYILILWRDKRLSAIKVVAFLLITLPTMFFVEVKAVVIWLPLVAGLVF